jgi:Carboxypeptidase regulatory-like domain
MAPSSAFAQTVTGSITGEVTDPSGAVISGAQVTAQNLETGVQTPTTTNKDGLYRINALPIGHYTLTVLAAGFNKATIPAFTLEVLQIPTFNVTLHVGTASTTVNVSAAAPILNTNNATLGATITANTIRNFPLNGLDFSALTLYIPGSIDTDGTSGTTVFERSTYFVDTPNMNGNRTQANNYTLDGIDMTADGRLSV